MSRPVFTLRGRVAFADGAPAPRVWVAVVDADPDLDDLLGVGVTGPGGEFRLSFTSEAFNQEPADNELTPDIYVVLSVEADGGRVAVLRRDFGALRFEGDEDLGVIALPLCAGVRPTAAPGLRVAPGAGKLVRRLRVDDAIVEVAAREVAPLVESLTGWAGLLDGVRFEIVDAFTETYRRRVGAALGRDDFDESDLERIDRVAHSCAASFVALWDSTTRVVYLHRPVLERWNVDALKVTIGHELVHVGQSLRHPELDREQAAWFADAWARNLARPPRDPAPTRAMWRFMANLEGYAHYIETKFLRQVYTHAAEFDDVTAPATARLAERQASRAREKRFEKLKRELTEGSWQSVLEPSSFDVFTVSKGPQYEAGLASYLARAQGDRPAPFDPALRPEPLLDANVFSDLFWRAQVGCAVSQLALASLYAKGEGGVPLDHEKAAHWFRQAAEAGLPVAAFNLAALLPLEDAEKLRWLRQAAEWGLPQAQVTAGILLLREGPARDPAEAASWFRQAIAQGDTEAMFRLGGLHLEGLGVEHDVGAGLDLCKRAAEAGHVEAMLLLSQLYAQGVGRKKDPISARLWAIRAEKASAR